MAFVSSPSSTNEVNTAYGVSTANTQVSPASTQVSTASAQVSTANLSDDTVYAFLSSQPNGSQLVHEDLKKIHEDDIEEMDLKWQLALLSMRTRRWDTLQGNAEDLGTKIAETGIKTALEDVNVEEIYPKRWWLLMELVLTGAIWQMMKSLQTWILWLFQTLSLDKLIGSQIADKSRKGVGFISYNAVPPPPTGLFSPLKFDLSNSDLEEFQQLEFEGYGPKPSKSFSEDTSNEFRESPDAPLIEELVSDDKLEKKSVFPTVAKIGFVRPKQQEKPVRKPVKYAEMYRLTAITMKGKGWNLGIIIQGFTWVFFLASKDETSGILKSFITEIENLVDKKVKIIRCDNGTEFKNRVMSEFCEKKGIKREFSKDGSLFDSSSKNTSNDKPQPSSDAGKKDDGVRKESGIDNQERPKNSSQDINTTGSSISIVSINITTGSLNINIVSPTVTTARSNGSQTEPDMFSLGDNATLEATHANFFGDETEVDM
ncbi:ribonuclease H-like domain-containing protein, partial [Tanacetum coccineum]